MSPESPIRLVFADDHELVRDGIRARLEDEPSINIVGEAANGHDVIALARQAEPDIVMLDINMPGMNGFETVEAMQGAGISCPVLMLSLYDNAEYVNRAQAIGTNGYLLKDVSQQEMIDAIRAVASGEFYVSKSLEKHTQSSPARECNLTQLTSREREVLAAIAAGKLNKQIAADLDISVRTVESHRSSIRQKTGGGNAATLATLAKDLGLMPPAND